jgi:SAM-dependent methyltransferase
VSWEGQAENWLVVARSSEDAYWFYRDDFFALLPPPEGRAIELGCGEGRVTRDLKERSYDVVALDSSPTLVDAARAADPEGEYLVADAAQLPFEDESFDLAVAYNSLMDMDDMAGAISEVARVLRPGARFAICVTHPLNDAGRFEHDGPDATFSVDVYRGRRPYDETFVRDGVAMRFTGWCYPLEGYTRPLQDAGFLIEAFREPASLPRRPSPGTAGRRIRIPNFLLIRAVKPA